MPPIVVRCLEHQANPSSSNAHAELKKGHHGRKITRVPDQLETPTELLLAWSRGDASAFDRLVPLVHDELRRLARRYMRRERPDHTLQATALVNEVYLRMIAVSRVHWQNRAHFFAIAARVMRRILVDSARRHRASQRGGAMQQVSLDEALVPSAVRHPDLVALDEALKRLESSTPEEEPGRGTAIFRRNEARGGRRCARRVTRHGQTRLAFREAVAAAGARWRAQLTCSVPNGVGTRQRHSPRA